MTDFFIFFHGIHMDNYLFEILSLVVWKEMDWILLLLFFFFIEILELKLDIDFSIFYLS